MRVPIAHALGWPERIASGVPELDLVQIAKLSFEDPDLERFPCLGLAQAAARAGGTVPAVLNAANEIAVAAFLGRRLNFARIAAVIESVLQQHEAGPVRSLADALAADAWARERAQLALVVAPGGRRMSAGILTSIVAFIVAIGVLVTVHEFGHFWVARRLGFKVLRFSLGFGRPLAKRVSRDADQVEYVLAAIPLGGYVRLLDERDGPVPPGEEHRAFNRRPPLARIAVLLAGPLAQPPVRDPRLLAAIHAGHSGTEAGRRRDRAGFVRRARGPARRSTRSLPSPARRPRRARPRCSRFSRASWNPGACRSRCGDAGGATRRLTISVPDSERRALTEPGMLLRRPRLLLLVPAATRRRRRTDAGLPGRRSRTPDRRSRRGGRRRTGRRLPEIRRRDPQPRRAGDAARGAARRQAPRLRAGAECGRRGGPATVGKIGLGAALDGADGFPNP